MSDSKFVCPHCKVELFANADSYTCTRCRKVYSQLDGYVDFLRDVNFYAGEVSETEMQKLLDNIDSNGYERALDKFFETKPGLRDYILNYRRADWLSHCIASTNFRCLDIGSGLGNISEILSHIYHQVYSLEAVKQRIEFQKRKFRNSKRTNIIISRGNALELPFPNDHFDLVVCNGVLEWIGMLNKDVPPRQAQLSFLRELKRVVSDTGCIYIGIENRLGLQFFLGAIDHSGLPYTSLLPRQLASYLVRKFGSAGGIYGDKSRNQREKTGYYTYTYSIKGYRSLLNEAGFKFKSYWVFPSYNDPVYSGNIEDKLAIKGFLSYLISTNRFRSRFKVPLTLLKKSDNSILSSLVRLFTPAFLFYCFKKDIPESFEDTISRISSLDSTTSFSGDKDFGYVLYNTKARPSKIARLKRFGYCLNTEIPIYDKTVPGYNPAERAWIENWIDGRPINPNKFDETHAAVKWLIDFQNKTRSAEYMTDGETHAEIQITRAGLLQLPELKTMEHQEWLDDYESYLLAHRLFKAAEHGDFFESNILIDPKKKTLKVIDWNYFRKEGDPFYDFIFFIICAMQSRTTFQSSVGDFERNLHGNGNFTKTYSKLQGIIADHFNFKLDMQKLIRYTLLRYVIRREIERGKNDTITTQFRKLLKVVS